MGLAVIRNTWNCHVLLVFSRLLPAGPTILWERLLLTLLVMLPVQPPPVESEIRWLAELETLPLLVRQLDFAAGALADVFPYLCCVHFFCVCVFSCKPGCGGYADSLSGAVSCTGHGESILKVTLARLILLHMEQGSMGMR